MVVLILLVLQLFVMLKISSFERRLVLITFIALIWNVGFLTLLHLELALSGTDTYGSDESIYYSSMLEATTIEKWFSFVRDDYNFTYVLFGTLILKTSWFPSVFLIRFGNVLLLINTLVVVYFFIRRFLSVHSNSAYWVILFIGINGMITWTAVRNLKDTLFLYVLVILLYLLFDMWYKKKFNIWRITVMALACYVLTDIRQWFIYLLISLIVVLLTVGLIKKKRYLLSVIICVSIFILTISFAQQGLNILIMYTKSYSGIFGDDQMTQFVGGNILSLPLSMARFILGPGPIRGLFGSESFMYYTTTGNILITAGSLVWWFVLPLFLLSLLSWKHLKRHYALLLIIIFYWATYSYAYAGSGDTRLRAVLYVFCAIYTLPFLVNLKSKNIGLLYLAVLIPIVLAGTYFSYVTLS